MPLMNFGLRETAMWHDEVPPMRARTLSSCMGVGGFLNPMPMTPMPPACASMMPTATIVAAVSPSSDAACLCSGPTGVPIGRTFVPILSCVSRSPMPSMVVESVVPCAVQAVERPLAGRRAETPGIIAGGTVDEEIGEVEKLRRVLPGFGEVFLDPEKFGRFHFGRDLPPDKPEEPDVAAR